MDDVNNIIIELLGLLKKMESEKGVPASNTLVDKNITSSTLNNKKDKQTSKVTDTEKKKLTTIFKLFFDVEKSTSKNKMKSIDENSSGIKEKLPKGEKFDKSKYTSVFSLFNDLYFERKKKEEVDEKLPTLSTKIAKDQESSRGKVEKTSQPAAKDGGGMSIMSMVVAGLTLLAASVGGIVASLTGMFGDMGGIVKVIGKLGFMGALKILSKTFLKKFAIGALKKLPIIGGIIGLAFAVKAFMDGKIGLGIAELISALLNFVPGAGTFLSLGADLLIGFAESKGMFDEGGALSGSNIWSTIKGWASSIGKTIWDNALDLPIVGPIKRFMMAYDAFSGGKFGEGMKQVGLAFVSMLPGGGLIIKGVEMLMGMFEGDNTAPKNTDIKPNKSWGSRLMDWIREKLKDLPYWIKQPLSWFGIISDDMKSEKFPDVAGGIKKGFDNTAKFAEDVWKSVDKPMKDAVDGIGSFASGIWDSTKSFASKAWDTVKSVGDEANGSVLETMKNADALKNLSNPADLKKEEEKNKDILKPKEEEKNKDILKPKEETPADLFEKSSDNQIAWLQKLNDSAISQVKLLTDLVNIGTYSLNELKRMNVNGGGSGSNILTVPSNNSSSKSAPASIRDNRLGYAHSNYALA